MSTTELASPEKKHIRDFFNAIASRYDVLNSLLSFRMDERWRKCSRDLVIGERQQDILDIGIGTGKFLKNFLEVKPWRRAVGLDFSEKMLAAARRELPASVSLVSADFHDLPFANQSFDLIASSFTLRSVKNFQQFIRELHRILRPGGKVALLCLTRPKNPMVRTLYYPYLRYYLPCIGNLLSGHNRAYCFLSESIQSFQEPEETLSIMQQCGFQTQKPVRFAFGVATLLIGEK